MAAAARGVLRLFAQHWEVSLVAGLTGVGAFIRLWRLTTIPWGFHNDEGNVVLDAQRILREGWIGPYSLRALGYPIAINYYIAPFIKLIGPGVLGVRLPIAILGILSIPLAYSAFRVAAGWRVALCGTILYSFSAWHVHLSRVGFPVMGWQVTELGALLCLQLGLKTKTPWYFVIAGLLIGVGTWVYNSAFLFAAAAAIWLSAWFVLHNYRRVWGAVVSLRRGRTWDTRPVRDLLLLLILLASTLLAAWPLIEYARDPKNAYYNHFKSVYIFGEERKKNCERVPAEQRDQLCEKTLASSLTDKRTVLWNNSRDLYSWLTTKPHPDGADGLGVKPPVGKLVMYLAIVGAAIALFRVRVPAMGIGLLAVPLIFISTSLTIDGQFRRSFGMLPFIGLFGGLTLGLAWEWADKQRLAPRLGLIALIAAMLGTMSYQHMRFYFHTYPDTQMARFVFFPEMREASEFVHSVGHPYVYMYSERATLGHESRRVLASNMAGGEERSEEFGHGGKATRLDLAPDEHPSFVSTRPPDGAVFLFFGKYEPLLEQVALKYPAVPGLAEPRISGVREQFLTTGYRAYYLPSDLLEYYSRQESVTYPVRSEP